MQAPLHKRQRARDQQQRAARRIHGDPGTIPRPCIPIAEPACEKGEKERKKKKEKKRKKRERGKIRGWRNEKKEKIQDWQQAQERMVEINERGKTKKEAIQAKG
jgi:hypothetical protein